MTNQGKKKKQVRRSYTVPLNNDFQKLAKVAKPDYSFHDLSMTRDHLKCYICLMKKVGMKGSISKHSSQKAASQALKQVVAVLAEGESRNTLWFQLSLHKDFSESSAKFVLKSTRKGNISLKRRHSTHQIKGTKMNSLPECNYGERQDSLGETEATKNREDKSSQILSLGEVSSNVSNSVQDDDQSTKVPFRSISIIHRELPESNIGWPLLRKRSSLNQEALKARKARNKSFFEWISSLPCRVSQLISNNQMDSTSSRTTMSSDTAENNSVVDDPITVRTDSQLSDSFQDNKIDGSCYGKEESSLVQEVSSSMTEDSPKSRPGWPLLRIKNPASSDSLEKSEAEDISSLDQSTKETKQQTDSDCNAAGSSLEETICFLEDKHSKAWSIPSEMLQKKLDLVIKLNSCGCNLFTYEELKLATNKFSAENLIGEGGCSNVYKGQLPGGKVIAVKVLKQYKEAWEDFSLEVDIMSSLKHEHITPLVGVCNDEYLILVHDFLIGGSLEENLHGRNQKSVLPWKVRFKVAVEIAEALNYLHSNSSQPVIHRDVKSSNILLSKDYQPQLSDFGLAIWGPENSTNTTNSDLVGTFGCIAPEYFMQGLVSDKIDVYSYGVVLLELLTGKKPISSGSRRRKQSLVQWATPLLENGNLEAFLDLKLKGKMNIAQMHKMVLAATLCIKQTARLRPNINQVLKLLKGKEDEKKWFNTYITDLKEKNQREIDAHNGCQPNFSSLQDLQDYTYNASSFKTTQQRRLKLLDYLEEEQD